MYEIIDQETGRRIGRPVKTSRAASRMITILQRKTGKYPDYRKIPQHKDSETLKSIQV